MRSCRDTWHESGMRPDRQDYRTAFSLRLHMGASVLVDAVEMVLKVGFPIRKDGPISR